MDKYRAYVGSYTRGESKGIYMYDFSEDEPVFKEQGIEEITNPSFFDPFQPMENICIQIVTKVWHPLRFCRMAVWNI